MQEAIWKQSQQRLQCSHSRKAENKKSLLFLSSISLFSFPYTLFLHPLFLSCCLHPQIHGRVPYALGTRMRFPNPSVSLLWYEWEVKATCLDKASCLDNIISYYSVLRTQNLPKGRLSLSLSRASAVRGCLGTRTEKSLPCLWLAAAEGLELAVSSSHWRNTDKLSSLT